jgi:hypothetical protein
MTLALSLGLALGFALVPVERSRILHALPAIVGAYGLGAVLAAPFIYYTVTGLESGSFIEAANGDLLNFVVPTPLIAAGGQLLNPVTGRFSTSIVDSDIYIGLPTLLIVGLYVWCRRREPVARLLAVSVVVGSVLALGPSLRVEGHRLAELPWHLLTGLPILPNVITERLVEYALLPASLAVALWVASTPGRWLARPAVLPALALVSILPAPWHLSFVSTPDRPQFFSRAGYRICIPKGETLLVFPYGRFGDSMLYQAESGFWFKLAEGNLGRDTFPPKFVSADPTVIALQFHYFGPGPRPSMSALKLYARRRNVDRIATLVTSPYPSGPQMHDFGPLQAIGDVLVAPACGYDSLAGDTRRIAGQ